VNHAIKQGVRTIFGGAVSSEKSSAMASLRRFGTTTQHGNLRRSVAFLHQTEEQIHWHQYPALRRLLTIGQPPLRV